MRHFPRQATIGSLGLPDVDGFGIAVASETRGEAGNWSSAARRVRDPRVAPTRLLPSAFASGASWAGSIAGKPIYCAPAGDIEAAFEAGIKDNFPNAEITFDKFHVIKLANEAVDQVWREEARNNFQIKGRRYIFLKNVDHLTQEEKEALSRLEAQNLDAKTSPFKPAPFRFRKRGHLNSAQRGHSNLVVTSIHGGTFRQDAAAGL